MQTFDNPESLIAHVDDQRRAAQTTRDQLARSIGTAQCYYMGAQWIQSGMPIPVPQRQDGLGRYLTNWNPDSSKLRATVNRVTKYVTKEAAATHPEEIYVDGFSPDSDSSLDGEFTARTLENLANLTIDQSGFLREAQDANANRSIAGSWGLLLYINTYGRMVNGSLVQDRCLKAMSFDPTHLILDPAITSRRLTDHDEIVYEDVWTLAKVKRVLGIELDERKMPEISTLAQHEINMARISGGMLYSHYLAFSKTKGTRVAQVYLKDPTGRHGVSYTMYQDEERKWKVYNFESPESPFGGSGLPLVLIHGHRKPGVPFGIAGGQMTKDDQDRLNLLWSQFFRHQQKYGSPQVLVDKRNFAQDVSDDDIRSQFTNRVGGVVVMGPRGEKQIAAPTFLTPPQPPAYIAEMSQKFEGDMQQQVSRADIHFGLGIKSHVPDAAYERAAEESDQILGIRVREDALAYEDLLNVAVGTVIRFVNDDVPGTLVGLTENGFGQEEFASLMALDPNTVGGCQLKIRESSVRYRSLATKQQSLDTALVNKAIDPIAWRLELATLDIALTANDRQMQAELTRKVQRLVSGEDWRPLPLGEYNAMALTLLRRALFDRKVRGNPQAEQRIIEAIVMQNQAAAMEQTLSTPQDQETPQESGPGDEQEPQQPDTIGSLLAQVGGGGNVAAQPVA